MPASLANGRLPDNHSASSASGTVELLPLVGTVTKINSKKTNKIAIMPLISLTKLITLIEAQNLPL